MFFIYLFYAWVILYNYIEEIHFLSLNEFSDFRFSSSCSFLKQTTSWRIHGKLQRFPFSVPFRILASPAQAPAAAIPVDFNPFELLHTRQSKQIKSPFIHRRRWPLQFWNSPRCPSLDYKMAS
jgi:hypothetical protein